MRRNIYKNSKIEEMTLRKKKNMKKKIAKSLCEFLDENNQCSKALKSGKNKMTEKEIIDYDHKLAELEKKLKEYIMSNDNKQLEKINEELQENTAIVKKMIAELQDFKTMLFGNME